jgi:long-chain acyl-CoA synthetase
MKMVYSNKRRFRDDLIKHKPHVLISVPRVFESLHVAIMAKLQAASAVRKAIFSFFLAISVAFVHVQRAVRGLSLVTPRASMSPLARLVAALKLAALTPLYALANALVWKKIRLATGGRVKVFLCGGGTVPGYLEDFFESAQIEICVGYGLTETSPVICNRYHEHNVRGSAGLPLPDTAVEIVDLETRVPVPNGVSGELLVKGPQVFSSYHRNPEATAKAFDSRGFFDTGDLAYIGPDGDVVITGRSKDIIVLSNGENIEPVPIEDAVLNSPLVDQIILVGQDERQLCALVVPDMLALESAGLIDEALCERIAKLVAAGESGRAELKALGGEMVTKYPGVVSAVEEAATKENKSRSSYTAGDRIRHIRVILEPFSLENGLLTQTLKIKRNVVGEVYAKEIGELCQRR